MPDIARKGKASMKYTFRKRTTKKRSADAGRQTDAFGVSGRWMLLHTLLVLSVPTIIEEVLATLLQYVDTAMVGQLGEQATASVSITTNVTWLVNSIPGAIGTAMLLSLIHI